ncbi:AraC family transcriptional regulator [Caenimonas terrae]|uniref:AraC family transcriptional regulator n=1 Tax=Caenimonas terrae TaxID=696074 RepID=A0ABW0NI44_9BURK
MAFARAIVAAYARYGQSPAGVLRLAQITPAQLHKPEGRITAAQMEVLSGAAMQELDDEGLGAFGRRLPWGSYGMLARASLSAPDLGLALKRWCRHHALITDDIALRVAVSGATATIAIEERRDLGAAREFCLVHVLRNIHGLACWYIDSRIPLQGARFPFDAPPHAAAYPLLFPGPLSFGAPQATSTGSGQAPSTGSGQAPSTGSGQAAIQFDARYLALPLRRDEKALGQMLKHALPLTVLQYRRDRLLVEQVRQALAADPARGHNATQLADLLNVSPRTLHRQLKEEGASLQRLKDEVRFAIAKDILNRTDKPIKQVATAAGFGNDKSFARAFRAWTGTTPAEFRNRS